MKAGQAETARIRMEVMERIRDSLNYYQLSFKNPHFYLFLTPYYFIPLSISSNLIFALITVGVQTVNDGWSRERWMRSDM